MSNNVKIQIAADVADLTVKAQVAKATITDLTRDLNRAAKAMKDGDTTPELTARALQYAEALVKERASLAAINRDIAENAATQRVALAATNGMAAATQASAVSTGQMKFAMRDLSYQISDVSTMFAMGAKPMQIFASQGGQIVGALSMMAGEAKGVLGVLGGPWGMIATSAAVALTPLIAKLFETGEAAKDAEIKIMGFADILAKARTKPMEALGDARADYFKEVEKLNQIKAQHPGTRNIAALQDYHKKVNDQEAAVEAAKSAWDDLPRIIKNNETLFSIVNKAGRFKAVDVNNGGGGKSGGGGRGKAGGGSAAASTAEDDEIAANQAANQQIEALAEDRFKTEADLSRIALQSKLADIDAEQRAGAISAAQAIRNKAANAAEMESIDQRLQSRIFIAELNRLEADRSNYKEGTGDYLRYTQQIEALKARHLNRVIVAGAKAIAAEKEARKQATAAELTDLQREEERKRAIQERTFAPFAQQIARMLTLQRSFIGTMRDLWGSLTGIVEMAVSRMVQSFLIGLATQDAAGEAQHRRDVIRHAKDAAAGAWKATVSIPIVGPILAPIAAATAFAGVMAFSAEQGWDVPDSAGPGIDGRGGRPAVIHPREMVLPAAIADSIRRGSMADAYPAQVSSGMDLAAMAMARPIAVNDGRASLSAATAGTRFASGDGFEGGSARGAAVRRSGHGDGGPTHVTLNVSAIDARGVRRLLVDNQHAVASAVDRAVRHGHRSEYRK